MDEALVRSILEDFTKDIDKKLDLIDSKLNQINNKVDETNLTLEEVIKKCEINSEEIKVIQVESTKHKQDIFDNKKQIHMNDMRIRELEEELEKKNNNETIRLNQLFTTVGVLKAQLSDLTSKFNTHNTNTNGISDKNNVTKPILTVPTPKVIKPVVPEPAPEPAQTGTKPKANTYSESVTKPPNVHTYTSTTEENPKTNSVSDAKKIIGLYPVNRRDIAHWVLQDEDTKNISDDEIFHSEKYSHARNEAANEFLYTKLSLRIGEVDVTKTKMSKNPYSAILWITLNKQMDVSKIFRRAAQIKTKNIRIMTYFPSSIWPRKMSIEKNLAKARSANKNLKYQIRLGNSDLQLFVKDNKNPMWSRVDLDHFGPIEDIPDELNDKPSNKPENNYTANPNKRKEITPNKPEAKKTKEDSEVIDLTTNKDEAKQNDDEDKSSTASATLDTDMELDETVKKGINNDI